MSASLYSTEYDQQGPLTARLTRQIVKYSRYVVLRRAGVLRQRLEAAQEALHIGKTGLGTFDPDP